MKKILIGFAVVMFLAAAYLVLSPKGQLGGTDFNHLESIATQSSTSTTSDLPVKVLSSNAARKYASITNDSDTVIYLYFADFSSAAAASTTVGVNKGIRLNAAGGSYEIDDRNLYIGEIWASSTLSSKKILFVEN
jgi:hypothetical protein